MERERVRNLAGHVILPAYYCTVIDAGVSAKDQFDLGGADLVSSFPLWIKRIEVP